MPLPIFIQNIVSCFIPLFLVLDPFLSLAVFIQITKRTSIKEKSAQALVAVLVAFFLLLFFIFTGLSSLGLLNISFSSFIVAGGFILLIFGIQSVLGVGFSKIDPPKKVAAVIIGTPLLSGPGAITTIIILSQKYGYATPIIALVLSMLITYLLLIYSKHIQKITGPRMIEIFSRVMGLIISAIAIEFIKNGILSIINSSL